MQFLLPFIFLGLFISHTVYAPPVKEKATTSDPQNADLGLEYESYLKQVVQVLESDEEFRKRLENANASEITDGSIARHLQFASHTVRSKLDELKRIEVSRLKKLALEEFRKTKGQSSLDAPGHINHGVPNKFEIEDLRKLIWKTTKDLDEADVKRKEDFKDYEMEREHIRREKLNHLTPEEKAKEELKFEEQRKKHLDHPKLNHPGSKDQLEEVWEESDNMKDVDFNPKTFFALHDVNGDGVLDQEEVEALFQKELDKAYDPNSPEDDMVERYEEMNRMREHVFSEFDKDKNHLISWEEFHAATEDKEFEKPPEDEFKTLDEGGPVYTEEELKEYEKELRDMGLSDLEISDEMNRTREANLAPHKVEVVPADIGEDLRGHNQQNLPEGHMQVQHHSDNSNQVRGHPQEHPQQDQEHPQQAQGHPQQVQGHPQQAQEHPQQVQGHPQQVQGHPQQAQGHPQQVQGHPQQAQEHPQQVQGHPQQVQGHPQQV